MNRADIEPIGDAAEELLAAVGFSATTDRHQAEAVHMVAAKLREAFDSGHAYGHHHGRKSMRAEASKVADARVDWGGRAKGKNDEAEEIANAILDIPLDPVTP